MPDATPPRSVRDARSVARAGAGVATGAAADGAGVDRRRSRRRNGARCAACAGRGCSIRIANHRAPIGHGQVARNRRVLLRGRRRAGGRVHWCGTARRCRFLDLTTAARTATQAAQHRLELTVRSSSAKRTSSVSSSSCCWPLFRNRGSSSVTAASIRSRSLGANARLPLDERLARPLAHLGRRAAETHGEQRAQHVGEAGEELAEVDARVGQPRRRTRTRRPRAARRSRSSSARNSSSATSPSASRTRSGVTSPSPIEST